MTRETGEVRKRFFGDTDAARAHMGQAMNLLGYVKSQMRLGGLQQFAQRFVLASGVVLFAQSVFGQDEVRIFAPGGGVQKAGKARAYCVWGPDTEAYITLPAPEVVSPAVTDGQRVYVNNANVTFDLMAPVLHVLRASDMALTGTFSLGTPGSVGAIRADTATGRAAMGMDWEDKTELVMWEMTDMPVFTRWNASDAINNGFHLHGGNPWVPFASSGTGGAAWALRGGDDGTLGSRSNIWLVDPVTLAVMHHEDVTAYDYTYTYGQVTLPGDFVRGYLKVTGAAPSHLLRIGVLGTDKNYGLPTSSNPPLIFAAESDGDALWFLQRRYFEFPAYREATLWRHQGAAWSEVDYRALLPADVVAINPTNLLHDAVTGAIAVGFEHYGALVFNGRDCFNAGQAPFFHRFTKVPATPRAGSFQFFHFHDATLVVGYDTTLGGAPTYGAIKIGRLKQTKQTEESPE